MKFMNDYDIESAIHRFTDAAKPNRLGLALVVANLAVETDLVSDGWHSWPKPCRAAERAISLIESRTYRENQEQERVDITDAELTAAVRPIKAFLTRHSHVYSAEARERILRGGEVLTHG